MRVTLGIVALVLLILTASCGGSKASNGSKRSAVLTKDEILKATYIIHPNASGEIPTQEVVFPALNGETQWLQGLTGTMYVYPDGTASADLVGGKDYEAFWIYKYRYNADHSEATVYISGNFAGKGNDNRTFFVNKVNGKIVTKEQEKRKW